MLLYRSLLAESFFINEPILFIPLTSNTLTKYFPLLFYDPG